ncbi:hypothetical protein DMJ13_25860 [halophilic archaeon]|nr:hypothetical protein DMJ13_25860 [halophilic archaeon]
MNHRATSAYLRHPLPLLSGLLVFLSLVFFPLSQGSLLTDLPEVILPLAVSLGIALYAIRLLQAEYDVDRVKRIAMYGWTGAIVGSVGVWVLTQQLHRELSIGLLLDEALMVVSVGSGIGVLLGAHVMRERHSVDRSDRDRVLAESVWTTQPPPNPILTAITTQLGELDGVDPLELDPLCEHINPEVFTSLQEQDDSQWQLLFYTDDYEIRVSGQGTVTIYNTASSEEEEESDIVISLEDQW